MNTLFDDGGVDKYAREMYSTVVGVIKTDYNVQEKCVTQTVICLEEKQRNCGV